MKLTITDENRLLTKNIAKQERTSKKKKYKEIT